MHRAREEVYPSLTLLRRRTCAGWAPAQVRRATALRAMPYAACDQISARYDTGLVSAAAPGEARRWRPVRCVPGTRTWLMAPSVRPLCAAGAPLLICCHRFACLVRGLLWAPTHPSKPRLVRPTRKRVAKQEARNSGTCVRKE